ncbi:aminoglycoside phosphotransferase family protein [Macrococcus sp. DPC7161]|uniref:aminoglycoside phosphotransferase family protein n=1 Tax=Macrococcus sp. DPC7161 TaxID=2507060 RepID=UPI00100C2B4A|nr:aminoglycoside phosphotransferase family protein [Macrococcus sp. DPC7161]RXK18934.1 aminoglycoside phosphotransferase family protein [Macrococcus sp. DPC7161]
MYKLPGNIEVKDLKLLQKKDYTEVFQGRLNNKEIILKTFKKHNNYYREVNSLKSLQSKFHFVPRLMENNNSQESMYFIEEKIDGKNLLDNFQKLNQNEKEDVVKKSAQVLGMLNTCLNENELKETNLWKFYDMNINEYKEYDWKKYYLKQIQIWISNIDKDNIDIDLYKLYEEIENKLKKADSLSEHIGFIHRDYGFRNILVNNDNEITGVIDFEHAMIGDILFDITKIIFNDLDFMEDQYLANLFIKEWSNQLNIVLDERKMWLYLMIQGLGVVQWVDSQKIPSNKVLNAEFREKGIKIIKESIKYFVLENKL